VRGKLHAETNFPPKRGPPITIADARTSGRVPAGLENQTPSSDPHSQSMYPNFLTHKVFSLSLSLSLSLTHSNLNN